MQWHSQEGFSFDGVVHTLLIWSAAFPGAGFSPISCPLAMPRTRCRLRGWRFEQRPPQTAVLLAACTAWGAALGQAARNYCCSPSQGCLSCFCICSYRYRTRGPTQPENTTSVSSVLTRCTPSHSKNVFKSGFVLLDSQNLCYQSFNLLFSLLF